HELHKVFDRIEFGQELCPFGHALDGREKTAHQNEYDHKEPCDEHRLLLGIRIIGDEQTHAQNHQYVNGGVKVHEGQTPQHADSENELGQYQANGQRHHSNAPLRKKLPNDEVVFVDGRDIDLFRGAHFVFPDNVHA